MGKAYTAKDTKVHKENRRVFYAIARCLILT
jgi:hypothetical protein